MPFPNNIPIGNIDFVNQSEALSALQRNWQIAAVAFSFSSGAGLTVNFSASTLYGVFADSGTVIVVGSSNAPNYSYKVTGGGAPVLVPFGLPMGYMPPGGPCVATVSTSTVVCTILYK